MSKPARPAQSEDRHQTGSRSRIPRIPRIRARSNRPQVRDATGSRASMVVISALAVHSVGGNESRNQNSLRKSKEILPSVRLWARLLAFPNMGQDYTNTRSFSNNCIRLTLRLRSDVTEGWKRSSSQLNRRRRRTRTRIANTFPGCGATGLSGGTARRSLELSSWT